MKSSSAAFVLVAGLALVSGCGNDPGTGDDDAIDAGPDLDANVGNWQSLMEGDWSLAAGHKPRTARLSAGTGSAFFAQPSRHAVLGACADAAFLASPRAMANADGPRLECLGT